MPKYNENGPKMNLRKEMGLKGTKMDPEIKLKLTQILN